MDRPNDTLTPETAPWLNDPGVHAVCRAISADGAAIFFVGGCVRNAILGLPDSDIDMATPVRPQEVMRLAKAAGLEAVPTGIDHGTVTVVVDGAGFEVTTFRKDVQTDGRRAVVSYSDRIEDDARRRDFTLNALYARPDGHIIDPLGGMADLRARRIKFIENAEARIREDYLRILRFFRFSAWYADASDGFDETTLNAISRTAEGISQLSAERVGAEMAKLLGAPDPGPALAAMRTTGVLAEVLPGSDDTLLGPVVYLESQIGASPDWRLRLAALGGLDAQSRLRLSRADARQLERLTEAAYSATPLAEIAYRHGAIVAKQAAVLRAALANTPLIPEDVAHLDVAAQAQFPVVARDLMPLFEGAALGAELARLEARWIASGFALSRADLLNGR